MHNMQTIFFTSSKDITIAGNLFLPKEYSIGVLILHGGGHGNKERFLDLQQILFKNNIASLAIDFRGVGQSSGEFIDGSLQHRIEDAKAALVQLKKYTKHIAVFGSSMGGFIAPFLAEDKDVRAVVLLAPAAYSIESENKPLNEEFTKEITKMNSWKSSRSFDILSKWNGKLLVIYGEKDVVIPDGAKEQYKKLAAKNGEFILLNNVGHSIMKPQTNEEEKIKISALQLIVDFLKDI